MRPRARTGAGWWTALVGLAPLLMHCAAATPTPSPKGQERADLAAARDLFERNLEAIRSKDQVAYLDCYRPAESLVQAGPDGVRLGYAAFAEQAPATGSDAWPESIEASNLSVHWLRPGLVYGMYDYRVVFDGVQTRGVSERLFMKIGPRWYIAVTTAFPTPDPKPVPGS